MKYISIVLLLTVLLGSCSKSEHNFFSTLYGVVTDSETGEPINAASIMLTPGGKTTVTESDGHYEFADLDVMQYTIMVQKDGYYANRKTINAISGETIEVDIQLSRIKK